MFFCKVTATTECYPYGHTLSRHDALPILLAPARRCAAETSRGKRVPGDVAVIDIVAIVWLLVVWGSYNLIMDRLLMRRVGLNQYMKDRSEEHTSELQSLMRISYAVFCLKKNTHPNINEPRQ